MFYRHTAYQFFPRETQPTNYYPVLKVTKRTSTHSMISIARCVAGAHGNTPLNTEQTSCPLDNQSNFCDNCHTPARCPDSPVAPHLPRPPPLRRRRSKSTPSTGGSLQKTLLGGLASHENACSTKIDPSRLTPSF